jgi:predicted RNase H-like nuclease (RuvC/YqgF family)
MNPAMLKLMKAKKKRPVDPNAPPRPNLMSHDKVIRGQKATIDQLQFQVMQLAQEVEAMKTKLTYQTQYLQQLHSQLKR